LRGGDGTQREHDGHGDGHGDDSGFTYLHRCFLSEFPGNISVYFARNRSSTALGASAVKVNQSAQW
jgi:hypothetical protein